VDSCPDEHLTRGLIGLRGAIGAGVWLAPSHSGRLFGLDPDANPQASYVGRLFGVRDAALAFGLSTSSDPERARWLRIGIACDLADASADVIAGRRGELPTLATVLLTATALGAAALGVATMRDQGSPSP
jgi:hypothetical protein